MSRYFMLTLSCQLLESFDILPTLFFNLEDAKKAAQLMAQESNESIEENNRNPDENFRTATTVVRIIEVFPYVDGNPMDNHKADLDWDFQYEAVYWSND